MKNLLGKSVVIAFVIAAIFIVNAYASSVNQPPILNPIGDKTITEFGSLFTITASDVDGDHLSFTAEGLPQFAKLVDRGDGTADIYFNRDSIGSGVYAVDFRVIDVVGQSDSERITLVVLVGNNGMPLVMDITPIEGLQTTNRYQMFEAKVGDNIAIPEGEFYSFDITAEGSLDALELTAMGLPEGCTIFRDDNYQHPTKVRWICYTGSPNQPAIPPGDYPVTFTVTHLTNPNLPPLSDSETVTLTVTTNRQPPILDPIGNRAFPEGEFYSFDITAEGSLDGLELTTIGLPEGCTVFRDDGYQHPTKVRWICYAGSPNQPEIPPGDYPVTFTVTDVSNPNLPGPSDSETVTLTVTTDRQPPVLDPIGNQAFPEGEFYSFDITAEGSLDALELTAMGLPEGCTVFRDDGYQHPTKVRWICYAGSPNQPAIPPGDYPVTFTVTEDLSNPDLPPLSDSETITLTVTTDRQHPVLDPIGLQEFHLSLYNQSLLDIYCTGEKDNLKIAYSPLWALSIGRHTYELDAADGQGNIATITRNFFVESSGCFLKGTPILMKNSTTRPIETLKEGDEVLSFAETTRSFKTDTVKHLFTIPNEEEYLIINNRLKVTPSHCFCLYTGEWLEAGELKIGDNLLNKDGKEETITSIEKVKETVTVYNLDIATNDTFIADDIVVHNAELKGTLRIKDNIAVPILEKKKISPMSSTRDNSVTQLSEPQVMGGGQLSLQTDPPDPIYGTISGYVK